MISSDTYTITNPALCSFILWSFLQGYESNSKHGCPYVLLFLPLPIMLSESMRKEFKGTNSSTGLHTWISRNQKTLLRFNERVQKTNLVSKEAIIFGVNNRILKFQDNGTLISNNEGLILKKVNTLSVDLKEIESASKKLGKWVSQIESVSSILISLGIFYEEMEYRKNLSL